MSDLEKNRALINEIDEKMAKLFEERMKAVEGIAEYKKENSLPIFDAKREQQLLEKNTNYISSPLIQEYYVPYFQGLLKASRAYQERLLSTSKIAYCGVEGAYAYLAAKKADPKAELVAFPSFEKAYKSVVEGTCDYALLPIENSFAGDVGDTMDLVFNGNLFINRMVSLEVRHALLAKKGTKMEDIKTVASHPQALAQCSDFIQQHGFAQIARSNTAVACKELVESDDATVAVIASPENASLYGLDILASHINTSENNTTRFALFSRALAKVDPNSKMGENFILVFTVLNEAGALAKTLNIIGAHGFNMRNLRSRPMKGLLWTYYFFVELEGNINTVDGKDMLNELSTITDRLKLAGVYHLNEDE
ncbi:MAG: chorismate mutase [Bacilli bacterium]|nr:chorismate mutase [Bacilli bacterium]